MFIFVYYFIIINVIGHSDYPERMTDILAHIGIPVLQEVPLSLEAPLLDDISSSEENIS